MDVSQNIKKKRITFLHWTFIILFIYLFMHLEFFLWPVLAFKQRCIVSISRKTEPQTNSPYIAALVPKQKDTQKTDISCWFHRLSCFYFLGHLYWFQLYLRNALNHRGDIMGLNDNRQRRRNKRGGERWKGRVYTWKRGNKSEQQNENIMLIKTTTALRSNVTELLDLHCLPNHLCLFCCWKQ